jgi:endonuclease/exonuclease/phosphatase family metal-dependent hydrolase
MHAARLLTIALLALAAASPQPAVAADQPADLRVMTFNIRYGTANDGVNRWDNRKEFLIATIKEFGPDLLGTQETLGFQRDYLAEQLPGYDVVGVGRDDGKDQGEMMALYFKRDRFEKLAEGHFWLSESPEKPGSKSWDSSLPRMATWVKLRERGREDAAPILFLNTHFDHRGPQARKKSAEMIRRQVGNLGQGCSIDETGDNNAGEAREPNKPQFAHNDTHQSPHQD